MKAHLSVFLAATLLTLLSCEAQVISLDENESANDLELVDESLEIGIYETYRLHNEDFLRVLRNIKVVDEFIPIFRLDFGSYPENVVGITEDESSKSRILEQLLLSDSIPPNSNLVWSKRREYNMQTDEEAYHLYMLKNDSRIITNTDIKSAKSEENPFGDDFTVDIILTDAGTQKWSEGTKEVYENNRGYIAILIDGEAYSSPRVMGPLNSSYISFGGFATRGEAEKIAQGIMRKDDD